MNLSRNSMGKLIAVHLFVFAISIPSAIASGNDASEDESDGNLVSRVCAQIFSSTTPWNMGWFGPKGTSTTAHPVAVPQIPKIKKEEVRKPRLNEEWLSTVLAAKTRTTHHLRDKVYAAWLTSLSLMGKKSVSLILGSPFTTPSPQTLQTWQTIVDLIEKNGIVALYDADSPFSDFVRANARNQGSFLGVTANPEKHNPEQGIICISNTQIRMSTFWMTKKAIASMDSVVGVGTYLGQKADIILDLENRLEPSQLNKWVGGLKVKLGMEPPMTRDTVRNENQLISLLKYGIYGDPVSSGTLFNHDSILRSFNLTEYERTKFEAFGKLMANAEAKMKTWQDAPVPGGAVVFGSGKSVKEYTSITYKLVRKLAEAGVPIATGGAGGLMEVSNAAAFDAGGVSIGITKSLLKGESDIPTEIHTHTIATQEYEERIPLLQHDRALVIVAPGGTGTRREIADMLLRWGSKPADKTLFVFIGNDYYGGLIEWLETLRLPPEFMKRILILPNEQTIPVLVDHILKVADSDPEFSNQLRMKPPESPRNAKTGFEPILKPKEPKDKEFSFWGY